MDLTAAFSRIAEIWPQNRFPILLGIAGVLLFVLGLIWSFNPFSQESTVEFLPSDKTVEASSSAQLVIDVQGAVGRPGVYSLKQDARIQDALTAAGGLSEDADKEWVAKSLNLAAKISDGAKIYIPTEGESITGTTHSAGSGQAGITGSSGVIGVQTGLININTATSSELDKLSGIGPVTAQKIIDSRPYSTIDELLSKKVLGKKVFEDIKDKVAVY